MLIVATGNKGKIGEFRRILPSQEFLTMREAGVTEEIEETGKTFEENALIKARTVCRLTGRPTVADDSGLTVDALGGAPGIYSARYAGENATDAQKVEKLLNALSDVPAEKRSAAFVCVIAYVLPDGTEKVFRGECSGHIAKEAHGANGFGYDPVFYPDGYDKTFGEMEKEEKNRISHRANALRLFGAYMRESRNEAEGM